MPGLLNRSTWEPLLLKASCIKSCATGCSLGITTHLTYANTHAEPVEGMFVYPLGDKEVVVGFEAVVVGHTVNVRIQSRGRLEDCCLDCCSSCQGDGHCRSGKDCGCCGPSGRDMQCTNGHLLLDEDLERTTFIISTGIIGPMDLVTVILSTTMEVPTLENGAVRLVYPSVLTPIVRGQMVPNKSEHGGRWDENGPTNCFGSASGKQDRPPGSYHQCAHTVFNSPATSCLPYELSFQLLVRGACLLAGLESPTHALRADADPSAQSASATYITLAEDHPYDRHVEIILHLSEPHQPQVILERGRLTFQEYEQQICTRRDFIRCCRKEAEPEKKMDFVRKRFHKDILCNPVLMLNFCPDLLSVQTELHQATREIFFLLDRSSNMTGTKMDRLKEGMVVAIKSLPPSTLLNIVSFSSNIKTLFLSSKTCTNATLAAACEYIQKMRADPGGTNLLAALSWVYQQPGHRGCPRQVFILMDNTVSTIGRVLELAWRNAGTARCFGLGLGPLACRRLLQGVAKVTGGYAEFLGVDERLQPKLIKALKKAFEPVLTDIRIDWFVPDNMEALLSPNEIPPLYPGSCLIGYCTLYDLSGFKRRRSEHTKCCFSRGFSRGSVDSVSGQSQDELCPLPTVDVLQSHPLASEHSDIEEALREISREISSEFSCARALDTCEATGVEQDSSSDVRTRISRACYVQDQYMLTRCSLSSDKGLTHSSSTSKSTAPPHDTGSLPHGLERVTSPEPRGLTRWESPWKYTAYSDHPDTGVGTTEQGRRRQKALARSAMAGRSFSSPQGELDLHRLRRALEKVSFHQALGSRLDETDGEMLSESRKSFNSSNSLLFPASPLDWDGLTDPESLFAAAPPEENAEVSAQCRSVIHGLLGGRSMSWEAEVDLSALWRPEATESVARASSWCEIVHQLTARSVIRDFENMAEREPDTDHGLGRRYRMKAMQTSKSCNTVCMYTAFTAVSTTANEGPMEMRNPERHAEARQSTRRGSRRQRASTSVLEHRLSYRHSQAFDNNSESNDKDDTPASPCSLTSWDSSAGGKWNPTSPSVVSTRSQRSVESWSLESFFSSRFTVGRLKAAEGSGKQGPLKPLCLSAEPEKHCDPESTDYLPLVRIQLASGAFLLTQQYSECVQISLDRLKRASPYLSHRRSLSPPFKSAPSSLSMTAGPWVPRCHDSPTGAEIRLPAAGPRHSHRHGRRHRSNATYPPMDPVGSEEGSSDHTEGVFQADSGRGSETDMYEGLPLERPDDRLAQQDLEGSSWATAVALAWLEHRCAGFFVEWELVAAKADFWLRSQRLPEGVDLASLKGAARQLFLLLRHWDENIKLNMLCYNPNDV